ncbi:MAG: 4Fe-4S dicluster domain-containing protein [Candidatus Methanomethylicus sp.]|nr:4Fe-4S dicluster domain-containing protein [Candidatus Methanomethylicus sp.]
MVKGGDLEKFKRVVVDQYLCVECKICTAVCPFEAWEMDDNNKARLIWDKCQDDFSCIVNCPVGCIWKPEDAPAESREKDGWLRTSRTLSSQEMEIFDAWAKRYGLGAKLPGNP